MATLQHDAAGFLTGEPIDLGRLPAYLRDIKSDVAAIKKAFIGAGVNSARQQRADSSPAVMPNRGASGRFVATPTGSRKSEAALTALAEAMGATEAQKQSVVKRLRSSAQKSAVATPGRDKAGRFVGGDGESGGQSGGAVAALANRLSALAGIGSDVEEVDPSIKAFREVAEPMRRGLEFFGAGSKEDKQNRWLSKIFKSLNVFQKESSVYDKASEKLLKKIEEKPGVTVPQSSGIPIIGPMLGAIGKSAIGGGLLGMLAKGGKGAAGLFKRIPVLGALLAGAGAAFDIYGSENSNLTRREKDSAAGQSIGGWAGSLGGVAAGALAGSMAGPVGTIIGGIVGGFLGDQAGQIIGEKFGGWVADLREADIPGKIVSVWDSAVATMSEAWTKAKGFASKGVDIAAEQLNGANSYIKANTGIDFKDMGGKWLERTKGNVTGAWEGIKQGAEWLGSSSTVGKAIKNLRTGGEIGSPELAMQLLMQKGWSKDDAAAISASINNESGFNTAIKGDGGKALGLAQWHPDRQKQFEKVFGKKLQDASFEEQISFIDWELRNTHKKAGDNIRAANSVEQKAAITEQQYEISALGMRGGVQPERIADARRYSNIAIATAPVPVAPKFPVSPPITEAPQVIEQLGSKSAPQFTINLPTADVTQDISDGRIAHVASGGFSRRPY